MQGDAPVLQVAQYLGRVAKGLVFGPALLLTIQVVFPEVDFDISAFGGIAAAGLLGGIAGSIVSLMISWLIDIISIGQGFTWDAFKLAVFGGENITRLSIVPLWLILFAIVFSIFIGLVSGYYPANKAVKIPALEAIKSE